MRAERRAQRERVIRKRMRAANQIVANPEAFGEPGRYGKQHPLDCGRTQCSTCRPGEGRVYALDEQALEDVREAPTLLEELRADALHDEMTKDLPCLDVECDECFEERLRAMDCES